VRFDGTSVMRLSVTSPSFKPRGFDRASAANPRPTTASRPDRRKSARRAGHSPVGVVGITCMTPSITNAIFEPSRDHTGPSCSRVPIE
jgi:hypothetical protein